MRRVCSVPQLLGQLAALRRSDSRRRSRRSFSPGLLHDEASIDELLQDAGQALLGDLQDVEQVGDAQAGLPVTKCSTR